MSDLTKWITDFYDSYIDPDGITCSGTNKYTYTSFEFYADYAAALDKRHPDFDISLSTKEPGLKMFSRKTARVYYLKSDQFGFSAPSPSLSHVYDEFLRKSDPDRLEEAKEQVIHWIKETRLVGGSFFWPLEHINEYFDLNPKYNLERGGTKFKKRGSYIEDRVDLTLYELKEIYHSGILKKGNANESMLDNNVLFQRCFSELMKNWLSEFDSFEEYVDFFAFSPFVDEKTKMPLDITSASRQPLNESFERKRILYSDEFSAERYRVMFDNITDMIKERNRLLLSYTRSL